VNGTGISQQTEILVTFSVLIFDDPSKFIPLPWGALLREHAIMLNWARRSFYRIKRPSISPSIGYNLMALTDHANQTNMQIFDSGEV
jgi:hypothetical protein